MGRFDRKYSDRALERLYELVIAQRRKVSDAVRIVQAEQGVEIRYQTAVAYCRRERQRVEGKRAKQLIADLPGATDALAKRLLNLLDLKTETLERQGHRANLDQIVKIGSAARELKRIAILGEPVTNGNGARKGATGKTANEKTREMLAKLGESNGTE